MASLRHGAFVLMLSIVKLFVLNISLSLASTSAPCYRTNFARPSYPSIHVSCSAVNWNLLLALSSAPCYTRSSTTSSCPAPRASNAIEYAALHFALLIRCYALDILNLVLYILHVVSLDSNLSLIVLLEGVLTKIWILPCKRWTEWRINSVWMLQSTRICHPQSCNHSTQLAKQ